MIKGRFTAYIAYIPRVLLFAGFRIRIDLMRIRIRIQADDLEFKKIYSWRFNFYFPDQKLQFTYPEASIKGAQATGEAFSPQKRTSST